MSLWTCHDPACRALNKSAASECESCSTPRRRSSVAAEMRPGPKPCDQCGTVQGQRLLFDLDTLVMSDRNAWLCSSCRGQAIARRAEADRRANGEHCGEPGCALTVREHIAHAKRLAARIGRLPTRAPSRGKGEV